MYLNVFICNSSLNSVFIKTFLSSFCTSRCVNIYCDLWVCNGMLHHDPFSPMPLTGRHL
jgi:hypothetical protein